MELNYGAGERMQLVLGMPYVRVRETDGTRAGGFGNITTGVKWRFRDDGRTTWLEPPCR
jgi:hypothetical protein